MYSRPRTKRAAESAFSLLRKLRIVMRAITSALNLNNEITPLLLIKNYPCVEINST